MGGKRSQTPDGTSSEGQQQQSHARPLTLTHPISPPRKKRRRLSEPPSPSEEGATARPTRAQTSPINTHTHTHAPAIVPSPFQLTKIRDLPLELNRDTVTLRDLLGDPLISECWQFNYLHDVDFLMSAFDEDVKGLVEVHVVHGFWKREDLVKRGLEEQASRYSNVSLHAAYLPEMFGTHHSKMMILLRHDDTAQVIIHTANMIVRDWTNMSQAVWRSPMLPLLSVPAAQQGKGSEEQPRIGSGEKFKIDLLNYLRSYSRQTCNNIIAKLTRYDFSAVRGALIASVPGRHVLSDSGGSNSTTRWGWPAMKHTLENAVPVHVPLGGGKDDKKKKSQIAIQISSIATLGPTDSWLRNTFFDALRGGRNVATGLPEAMVPPPPPPDFKVMFPTPDEIRKSLDGYGSGGSIHTKIQSPQQAKQLQYLRPMFCHWANDSEGGKELPEHTPIQEAGRKRAAPHIKTYIRYSYSSSHTNPGGEEEEQEQQTIDWALLTSANLSKQAWGDAKSTSSSSSSGGGGSGQVQTQVRIASYEIGVLVWPELFAEDNGNAIMVPSFLNDTAVVPESQGSQNRSVVVSLRMPYNLPLQPYSPREVPWVATAGYTEPDWKGQRWREG